MVGALCQVRTRLTIFASTAIGPKEFDYDD
jgi:hypothetical protein